MVSATGHISLNHPFAYGRSLCLPANSIVITHPLIVTNFNGATYDHTKLAEDVRQWCDEMIGKIETGFEEVPFGYDKGLPAAFSYLYIVRFSSVQDMIAFKMRWGDAHGR